MVYESGTVENLKDIFSAVIVGAIDKNHPNINQKQLVFKECLSKFLSTFTNNIFSDEYAVLYEVLNTIRISVFTLNQLRELLDRERSIILNSPYIDMSKWSVSIDNRPLSDDDKFEAFWLDLRDLIIELSNRVVTVEQFDSATVMYTRWYIDYESRQIAMNMALIMGENGLEIRGTRGRVKRYKGPDDMARYYAERQAILRELKESGSVKDTVVDKDWFIDEAAHEDIEDNEGILDTGLSLIDTAVGKMRRSNLITILGPPKGGKTRFTNYLVNRALSQGLNVCVWAVEGTKKEWISNQIACILRTDYGLYVNSKTILEKKYVSDPELKKAIILTKARLASDVKRGRLSFIEGSAYCEDFLDVIKAHYENKNRFDVFVMDQLVDILSRKGMGKSERISEGYIKLKNYITNEMPIKALALVPAQLKQTAIDYLLRNPDESIEITAGGESAETIRSADQIIGLFSSKEEKKANQMHIYSVGSRHAGDFDDFVCGAQLGCCYLSDDINVGNSGKKVNIS